ncbi:MAG: YqgE/AlgH family protein [Caulobacteraceae bacterium]
MSQAPTFEEDDDQDFLGGRLLVAMPGIEDPRFERAVILLCVHSPEHAMGIALNRPLDGLTLPDLLDKLGVKSTIALPPRAVLTGGPVERERGFVIHTDDYATAESTLNVAEGLALTATREVLDALGDVNRAPRCAIMALGCAGWSPGQLEEELKQNVWLICDPDEDLVFDDDHNSKWSRALAKIGVRADQLSGQSGHA